MKPYPRDQFFAFSPLRGIAAALAGIFMLLSGYLWYLQVMKGEDYLGMAGSNRIRLIRRPAPRGLICDRYGTPLVDSRPGFDVEIIPDDVENRARVEQTLGAILGLQPGKVWERVRGRRSYSYLPVTIESDVSMEKVIAIEERQPFLDGVRVAVYPRRRYIYGETAAHLLGYLGMISPGELEELGERGYTRQDLVGKYGVEKACEQFLAGGAGVEGVQVDNRGYVDRVLYRRNPVPGDNVFLTIDLKLQRAAEEALADGAGAVVALDPRNGELLAMASSPAFDPGVFIPPVDDEMVRELMSDEERPLMNRAIQGLYPPGSLFKPVVALAALEQGAVSETTTHQCTGAFSLGRHHYRCWYEKGHGRVNLTDALMFSCNVFFYNTGLRTGRGGIAKMAEAFGFDELSGIDIPGEKRGVVPTEEWQRRQGLAFWSPGDTVVMAIGQGYTLVTPLREALVIATIANGGTIYRPTTLLRVSSPAGKLLESFRPHVVRKLPLKEKELALVREGLKRAVNSRSGTGQKARLDGVTIAGKTGTVQIGPDDNRRHHAWFIGYAPFEDPQIALAVLLEGKESGGFFAAPAAKKIFAARFGQEKKP